MKRLTILLYLPILLMAISCEKEGDLVIKPVKAVKPIQMSGFVLGDVLEQYWNGEKVRDLTGRIGGMAGGLVFDQDEMKMELKSKNTGKIVYSQTFNINDDLLDVPLFYFEKTWQGKFTYPEPQGMEFLANFHVHVPEDSAAADVVMLTLEYYYDWNLDNPMVIVNTQEKVLASNIKGNWSDYVTLEKTDMQPTRPDTEVYPVVCMKKAGKNEFYIGNNWERSMINVNFPQGWETSGTVQCMYISILPGAFEYWNLVDLYPK